MPVIKQNQPGCCCETTCEIATDEFASETLDNFSIVSGDATQGSGVLTIDPSSVLVSKQSAGRPHMAAQITFDIDTDDAWIELRILWNTTTGAHLWGRIYTAAAGEQAGQIMIGSHDGTSSTTLQGPWYLYGVVKNSSTIANLCFDGETLSLTVDPDGSQLERCAAKVPSFAATDGEQAGIATDSTSAIYEVSNWVFRRQADDPANEHALWCVLCNDCEIWEKSAFAFLLSDEYDDQATIDWSITPTGLMRWITSGNVLYRSIYYNAEHFRGFSFLLQFSNSNSDRIRVLFWYENASNYWYVDCPQAFPADETVALYQVVGGVHTEQDRAALKLNQVQQKFMVTICLTDTKVTVQVEPDPDNTHLLKRVIFGVDDVTAPASWQVGVYGEPNCLWWAHSHLCTEDCVACSICESGFGQESYLVELTGAPCPFDGFNGSYITADSQVEFVDVVERCTYFYFDRASPVVINSGVKIAIPTTATDHPLNGPSQQGHLVEITIWYRDCDPRWEYRVGAFPTRTDAERAEKISEHCSAYDPECTSPGQIRTNEFTFYYWLAADQAPIDCAAIDWTVGLYDVFGAPTPTTPTDWPGVDFSPMSVRVRSLPLP